MSIKPIKSAGPQPLANYTEAFVTGNLVFAAGQLASDFKTGVPPAARKRENFPFYSSDIELQTEFVLQNLKRTFEAAGSSLENVVKAQVFLTDLNNFHGFDSVWKRYFKVPPPRTTIGCTGLLVQDTLVEIDLIGHVGKKGLEHAVQVSIEPEGILKACTTKVLMNMARTAAMTIASTYSLSTDFCAGFGPGPAAVFSSVKNASDDLIFHFQDR